MGDFLTPEEFADLKKRFYSDERFLAALDACLKEYGNVGDALVRIFPSPPHFPREIGKMKTIDLFYRAAEECVEGRLRLDSMRLQLLHPEFYAQPPAVE